MSHPAPDGRLRPGVPGSARRVTRVLLVRHGQSEWNANGRWQGQADPPLSTLGVEQATAAATRVAGFTAVYTSDLARARRTAEILGAALHLEPRLDARLRERDAAAWEGRTRPEIEAEWPGYLAEGRRPPGYETDDSVLARALAAITAIAERQTGDILVVSHFGVIRSLERRLAGPEGFTDVSVPNLGGRWLHHEAGRLRLGAPELLLDEARATRPEQI